MSIEAMKQALEALNYIECNYMSLPKVGIEAITSLRQAIAEAEKQEPVAYWNGNSKFALPKAKEWDKRTGGTTAFGIDIPLYTHPQPKREWVGLTNEEVQTCWENAQNAIALQYAIYHAIEAKLKQKNGYAEEKNT